MPLPTPMPPEEQGKLLQEVGAEIISAAPAGWVEVRYSLGMTAELSGGYVTVRLEDDTTVRVKPPETSRLKLRELRAGMYEPGKGTWFSAEYVVVRPGRYSVDFDYDNEPSFTATLNFKPSPMTYVNDLKWFPRDDEHIPGWLRQKIIEAEAAEEEK
ncbi:hypothetical protein [Actinomadura sp. 9N215]|uniref:hypothetical protein n=1 Tax=Actinomadura sp. 9N215 TaxID=3375150 RepID=UPI0037B797A9